MLFARASVDFVRCDRAERLPKSQQSLWLGFVDVKRLDRQAAGELFDLAVTQSGGVRAAVKDADGFDFGFVVFDELTETGDQCFGSLLGFGIKAGGQQLAYGDAYRRHDIHVSHVLKNPTAGFQLLVNFLSGFGFWGSQWNDKKVEQKKD